MNNQRTKLLFHVCLWVTISLAGFGSAVWQLWNNVMPGIFGMPTIGYWQACGLMGLCWVLFGGWRWPGHTRAEQARDLRRSLTDQERSDLREKFESRAPTGQA